MKPLARMVLLVATPVALSVSLEILSSTPVAAAKPQDVFVTNAEVPVTGTVQATQSGPWTVDISGTPKVKVTSLPSVNLAPGSNVTVTNTLDPLSQPVPLTVRDADNSVNRMVQLGGVAQFHPGESQIQISVFTTPTDFSLVLDSINVNGQLPAGQRAALTVYTGAQLSFAPAFVGSLLGMDRLVLEQHMHYVVGQNWDLRVWVDRLTDTTGSGFVSFTLAGHYVDH